MNIEELLYIKSIDALANDFIEEGLLNGKIEQMSKKEFNLFELVLGVAEGKYVEDHAEMTDKGLLCWASRYVEEELRLENANEDIFDILLYYDYKPSIIDKKT